MASELDRAIETAALAQEMSITGIDSLTFKFISHTGRDDEGHGHPAPAHEKTQRLTRVRTSAGVDGYCFGGGEDTIAVARKLIMGMNALDREAIWYKLLQSQRLERRA